MSRKLRIFISSTMRDLANERDAVCRRLASFNFEPVNAEGWVTTGSEIWPRIEQEIESCDVFVLLTGDRYGWIPTKGDKSDLGLSVTNLEYIVARDLNMPILPFLKRLDYDAESDSDDAKKRNEFRREVGSWENGRYVTEFELASDLADKVGHALVALLSDKFLSDRIRERSPQTDKTLRMLNAGDRTPGIAPTFEIPQSLVEAVKNRQAVLFAGAGISFAAGLPTAAVFSEHMAQVLLADDADYGVSPVGGSFAAIATDLEAFTSREYLIEQVAKVLDPPQGLQPTAAHRIAVKVFDIIVTTNWDLLFEEAAQVEGEDMPSITNEVTVDLPERAIIKLHGSISDPQSLLMTEGDVIGMDKTRPRIWETVRSILGDRPLVVTGTSLRDPSVVRLFTEARSDTPGFYVAPQFFNATVKRMARMNLTCIAADANNFLTGLAEEASR